MVQEIIVEVSTKENLKKGDVFTLSNEHYPPGVVQRRYEIVRVSWDKQYIDCVFLAHYIGAGTETFNIKEIEPYIILTNQEL